MPKSLWKGALFGGLALFVWSTISWMVLPWHNATLNTFTNEDEVARVLKANASGRGIYVYPGEHHTPGLTPEQRKRAEEAVMDKMKTGPFIFVSSRISNLIQTSRPSGGLERLYS